jgi:hypothetical protein
MLMDERITKFLMTALTAAAVLAAAIDAGRAQQPQFTPAQQAAANLGQQIGVLVANNAELADQVQKLTVQLTAANARVKALEDKYEPKEPPK